MKRRRLLPPNQSQPDPSTGSPREGEPVFLAVGRLRRAHGIEGEMLMDVLTDFPDRLRAGKTIYVGDAHQPVRIENVRGHNREMIIHLAGLHTPEDTAPYRNLIFYVKASELPALPEGEYYHHQLLGLAVLDAAGQPLGTLADILETGANDVYVVKTADGKELLLPAVDEVILSVDLARHAMTVRPPEWQ
ncbi:MAG TPA: ribosome maturation factor RimM [Anaerolineaceae bacterium]